MLCDKHHRTTTFISALGFGGTLFVAGMSLAWLTTLWLGMLLTGIVVILLYRKTTSGENSTDFLQTPFYLSHDSEVIDQQIVNIERIAVIADELWPRGQDLPVEELRQWIHEQSAHGIWIRLARLSDLRNEPDLIRAWRERAPRLTFSDSVRPTGAPVSEPVRCSSGRSEFAPGGPLSTAVGKPHVHQVHRLLLNPQFRSQRLSVVRAALRSARVSRPRRLTDRRSPRM